MNDASRKAFEEWLRTVCFQKPTQEAYDLAVVAWQASRKQAIAECVAEIRGMKANNKTAQSAINQCAEALEALK